MSEEELFDHLTLELSDLLFYIKINKQLQDKGRSQPILQCYTEIVNSDQKDSLMVSFIIPMAIKLTRRRCGGDQCILERPRQYVEERPQCYPL